MFRRPSSLRGVTFMNLFNDLPGSLSSSSGADPGYVSLPQQDSVYLYQLQFPNPCALTEETLHVSKIIDQSSISRKVYEQLQKLEIVKANGEVSTIAFGQPKFGRKFTNSLSMIPVSRQKRVIEFLFWWEGETMRLRKLMEEKAELEGLTVTSTGDSAEREKFQLLLNRVQRKISARPSKRVAEMEQDMDLADVHVRAGTRGDDAAPPAYV